MPTWVVLLCAAFVAATGRAAEGTFACALLPTTKPPSIRLRFSFPHPLELGVRGPSGSFRWLVSPQDMGAVEPVINKASLEYATELTFPFDALVANPNDAGDPRLEPLFGVPGRYTFVLGPNLESHRYPVQMCSVAVPSRVAR